MNARGLSSFFLGVIFCTSPLFACIDRTQTTSELSLVEARVEPRALTVGGDTPGQIYLRLLDERQRPMAQARLVIDDPGGTTRVTQPEPTQADGGTVATVRCVQPGEALFTVLFDDGIAPIVVGHAGPLQCVPRDVGNGFTQLRLVADHSLAAADKTAPTIITLIFTDSAGLALPGQRVTLTSDRATDSLAPSEAITDEGGQVRLTLTAQELGMATVTARARGQSAQTTVEFVAGPPDMRATTLEPRNQGAVADGQDVQCLDLTVRDAAGHAVPYASAAVHSDQAQDLVETAGPVTNHGGALLVRLRSTQAGTRLVTATTHSGTVQAAVVLRAGTMSSTFSTLVAHPAQATADTQSAVTMALQLADAYGNRLGVVPVSLAASSQKTAFLAPSLSTDANGHMVFAVTSAQAGTQTITASAQGSAVRAPVTFFAGPPTNQSIALMAAPTEAAADSVVPITLTLTVRDPWANPVEGQSVLWQSSETHDAITFPDGTVTHADGVLNAMLSPRQAGTRTVTASFLGLAASANILVTPGAPSAQQSTVAVNPNTVIADGNSVAALLLTVRDGYGNVVPHTEVVAALDSGSPATLLSPSLQSTTQAGETTVGVSSTRAGSALVTLRFGTAELQIPFHFVPGPVSALTSTLTAVPDVLPIDGETPTLISVLLCDATSNPVPDQVVQLAVSGNDNRLGLATGVTDQAGSWQTTLQSTSAGPKTLTALLGATSISGAVTFLPGPISSATSTLTVVPATLVADQQSQATLTAVARDAWSNPVSQASTLFSGSSNDVFTPSIVRTDDAGQAATQVTSTLARTSVLTASWPSAMATAPITWTPGSPSSETSYVVFSPNRLVADALAEANVSVAVNDAFNNPIANQTIFLSLSGNTRLGASSGSTGPAGVFATTVQSTEAGIKTLTATAAGVSFSGNILILAGEPNAALSTLTIAPQSTLADDQNAITLTALLRDQYNNPADNQAVTFSSNSNSITLTPAAGTTDTAGMASARATTAQVQTTLLTVAAGALSQSQPVTFTVGPPDARASTLIASPNQHLALNNQGVAHLSLVLRDAQGRALPGVPVTFSQTNLQGALSPVRSITGAAGQADASLTSRAAGTLIVTARSSPAALRASVFFDPQAPVCSKDVIFGERPVVLGPYRSSMVVARDMNLDNHTDIVALGSISAAAVTVYLGDGSGRFPTNVSRSVGRTPVSMDVVDLNKDNRPDVLVVSGGPTLYRMMGSSTQTLGSAASITGAGSYVGLCTGEITGDTNMDAVLLSASGPTSVTVFSGLGTGNFTRLAANAMTGIPVHCVIADFDNDGLNDLAVTNAGTQKVDLWRNTGGGALVAYKSLAVGRPMDNAMITANPNDIRAADLNHDGMVDLVVSNSSNLAVPSPPYSTQSTPTANLTTVSVLLGQSGGNFATQTTYTTDRYAAGLQVVDIDQDGHLDVVVACGIQGSGFEVYGGVAGVKANSVQIFRGRGDGTLTLTQTVKTGVSATSIAVADFDEDGSLDFAYNSTESSGAGVQFSQNGNFSIMPQYGGSSVMRNFVVAGDFNGDGRIDILGGFVNNPPEVAMGREDGSYTIIQTNLPGADEAVVGDFNGDGKLDVAEVGYYDGSPLTVGLGAGDGTFTRQSKVWNPTTDNITVLGLSVGDLNGDGLDDMVMPVATLSKIYVFLATADSNMFDIRPLPLPVGASYCDQALVADLFNRGVADVVMVCKNLSIYTNDGAANFAQPVSFAQKGTAARLYHGSLIDANSDGYVDVVALTGVRVNLFLNDTLGRFIAQPTLTLPSPGYSIAGDDFDNDGYADLIVSSDPGFILLRGNGTGSFTALRSYMGGNSSKAIVADVNHDGRPDVVMAVPENGLMIYRSQGCAP